MKEGRNVMTIGDGANDVANILEASIDVGLEGSQAAASNYASNQFCFSRSCWPCVADDRTSASWVCTPVSSARTGYVRLSSSGTTASTVDSVTPIRSALIFTTNGARAAWNIPRARRV
ncbi:hypothetical protein B0H17DRAFT_126794 [Mycena rosella]|uniref:Uncharacterized protein n=1 Tax=Mycena rosella TaxID=1033263 RepID=A0AAD7D321_MYCRO|nr:hypothetical protein B0H17DRAFT_126794 [Mycena rosella]